MPGQVVISPEIRHRNELATLCNLRGLQGHAMEIGTHTAAFACDFLDVWRGSMLTCVDPWETDLPGYTDEICWDREPDFRIAMAALARYNRRVRVIRGTWQRAFELVRNRFGFIYYDANHSRAATAQAMAACWRRLTDDGILAGHDYAPEDPNLIGVVEAVNVFAATHDATVYLTQENFYRSWYIYRDPKTELIPNERYLRNFYHAHHAVDPGPRVVWPTPDEGQAGSDPSATD